MCRPPSWLHHTAGRTTQLATHTPLGRTIQPLGPHSWWPHTPPGQLHQTALTHLLTAIASSTPPVQQRSQKICSTSTPNYIYLRRHLKPTNNTPLTILQALDCQQTARLSCSKANKKIDQSQAEKPHSCQSSPVNTSGNCQHRRRLVHT